MAVPEGGPTRVRLRSLGETLAMPNPWDALKALTDIQHISNSLLPRTLGFLEAGCQET